MILVTGGNGFIGAAILRRLKEDGRHGIRAAMRKTSPASIQSVDIAAVGDIGLDTDWSLALRGVSILVHCAARVHVMSETAACPLDEFRRVNVQGTLNLARQAVGAGVRRFIFVSSIKVNGETTRLGHPFTAEDRPSPSDAYGVSKMEAERSLRDLLISSGMELVIIRPPLVYGPGVKANFARLVRAVDRGLPLPLGAIDNRRSLVSLENLVDLVVTAVEHPDAANQTFLVSDGEDMSTTQLIKKIGHALGKPPKLIPVPLILLKLAGGLIGRREAIQRLCGSLQVDIEKTRQVLGWNPPLSVDEGLQRVAEEYARETPV